MKWNARLAALLCAGALTVSLTTPSASAGYADLSERHWAYADMMAAVSKGILKGMGNDMMAPDGELTWGQYLVMLSRAFAPDYYAALLEDGERWDTAGLYTVSDGGLLPEDDFLQVSEDTLARPITRQDVAVLLDRAIPAAAQPEGWDEKGVWLDTAEALSDFEDMELDYQPSLSRLYGLGVVKGKSDGTFGGGDTLRRCDGAVLLMRALALPREAPSPVPVDPTEQLPMPTPTRPDYPWADARLWELDDNPAKRELLYGSASVNKYGSKAEAQENMVPVTIPVWQLNAQGEKVPGTIKLQVNKALADDVLAIFTEIYNDPEQFPIRSAGCFSWRANTKSEHRGGTAIDISATENYQVRDGRGMVGTHWTPGEDPYSIPEDGSVVRIFHAHGWTWGGADWAGHSDPNVGYHDYMHFSYLGG